MNANIKTASKVATDLKVKDTLFSIVFGARTISAFEEYKGPFDFVDRIAVFADGSRMSLEKGHYYNTID